MLVLFGDVKNYKVALKCILALLSQQLNLLMFGNIPFTSIREATNELVGNDGQTLALRLVRLLFLLLSLLFRIEF